jgi:hypothetical protein
MLTAVYGASLGLLWLGDEIGEPYGANSEMLKRGLERIRARRIGLAGGRKRLSSAIQKPQGRNLAPSAAGPFVWGRYELPCSRTPLLKGHSRNFSWRSEEPCPAPRIACVAGGEPSPFRTPSTWPRLPRPAGPFSLSKSPQTDRKTGGLPLNSLRDFSACYRFCYPSPQLVGLEPPHPLHPDTLRRLRSNALGCSRLIADLPAR